MAFTVQVDDNYHLGDTAYRYKLGVFQTEVEAIAACRAIIDEFFAQPGRDTSPEDALRDWCQYGESPFIVAQDPSQACSFSAIAYARERAAAMGRDGQDPGKSNPGD